MPEVWFPTKMRTMPAGEGKSRPQAGRQAPGHKGVWEDLADASPRVQRNNKGVSIKAGPASPYLTVHLPAYSLWSS